MTHPDFTILYVDNPAASTEFYRALLGAEPVEASPTFSLFVLANGMKLGLWSRHTVEPKASVTGGGVELAFRVENNAQVDGIFADWKARGVAILQPPAGMEFGHTFTAADPDNHRLRVYAFAG
ncbi:MULTISPECIES: VOC family protein [unclassified Agrobacterium]|jgi:catechol 2,3-dioxygenase-like lactoylglutathione lyase family enzyme|uniref:Drug:proton antiporter n=1 Tax=Agrobacterium fabrum TaxID=1176649 RepID=A0A2W5FEU0_9HYPH|nr:MULTISPECIES: VOC family protein [unclassified Agrobacterium]PZP52804.1 MAG: drug:proton antiporter [Agrobacterium fabrum]MDH0616793.1 VOC family protein [Agrobacterium sp. GD03872]MDH0698121.1 VOC family protein [Agrobacterium sp. GD03871]MDH1062480.1 VOC family protein [Agrobacterium sp. GD03992]MDH2211762.1 VOC family protein [Agrobacterium sp. GD03643]